MQYLRPITSVLTLILESKGLIGGLTPNLERIMKKFTPPLAARGTPAAFLLTTIVTLTLWLGSKPVGLTEINPPDVVYFTGQATTIVTSNCSASGGLCQPAPACNIGAGPAPAGVNIQASVTLCEQRVTRNGGDIAGSFLTGRGTGTGFQFGKTYISLLYKNPNTATCSRFPATNPPTPPTIQNIPLADSDFASMMLGIWVVSPDGSAILTVNKQATVSGLANYTTVSVREMQPPNTACFDCGNDPAPQLNALRACGALTVAPADHAECVINCACNPL
jgi:hypothetical protein